MSDTRHEAAIPGPAEPPLVPGHLGQPRNEVVKAARTVLGACLLLEEMGVDMVQTRLATVKRLPDVGLRERNLVEPEDSVEVREREIASLASDEVGRLARGDAATPLDKHLAVAEIVRRSADED